MDSTPALTIPALTGLDAVAQGLAAALYLAVGAGALLRAPRDIRTRVFFALAAANAAAFGVTVLLWWKGLTDVAAAPRWAVGLTLAGLAVSALLLFHLAQVFPRRRPWIVTSGIQMAAGYVLIPVVTIVLVWFFPASPEQVRPAFVLGFIVFGFPLVVLLALVLPVTAIFSLFRSFQETEQPPLRRARVPLGLILVGQIAGGVLALVFAPAFAVLVPVAAVTAALTLAMWALGLLTPLAFALAVWQYDVLSIEVD